MKKIAFTLAFFLFGLTFPSLSRAEFSVLLTSQPVWMNSVWQTDVQFFWGDSALHPWADIQCKLRGRAGIPPFNGKKLNYGIGFQTNSPVLQKNQEATEIYALGQDLNPDNKVVCAIRDKDKFVGRSTGNCKVRVVQRDCYDYINHHSDEFLQTGEPMFRYACMADFYLDIK